MTAEQNKGLPYKIKNLFYKIRKNGEIWFDKDRMWHRKGP